MYKFFRGILLALIISPFFSFNYSFAQQIPVLEFFHGAECPHCHKEKEFLPVLQKMYPDLVIREYEIWHNPENKKLAEKKMAELGTTLEGVPANIIGENVITGFQKEKMVSILKTEFGSPKLSLEEASKLVKTNEDPAKKWGGLVALILIVIGGGSYIFWKK